jgi:predicted homoserine dehydrogenase-like protein
MRNTTRRSFLKRSAGASAAWVGSSLACAPWLRAGGANDDIRLGVIGIGSRVKTGGMGRNEIQHFRKIAGVRVVALCDVDSANLGPEVEKFAQRNEKVAAYADFRKLL